MRHLYLIFGLALSGASLVGAVAVAQNATTTPATPAASPSYPVLVPPTIAVVDTQRVFQESAAGRSIMGQLEAERRKIRDQVSRLDEEIRTAENELRRQHAVMTPEQANEQGQAIERKRADAQRTLQDRQEAFSKAGQEAENVFGDNMRDIVQQFAAERRIGMVVRKEVVISMSDKNTDITDEVIQRLNAKLPTVTVTVPPPGLAQAGPASPAEAAAPPAKASGRK